MKFQLIQTDEYNQSAILMNSENLDAVKARAKKELESINVENALTSEERNKNWEAYMPVVLDAKDSVAQNIVFGGRDTSGKFVFYDLAAKNAAKVQPAEVLSKVSGGSVRIFLGEINKAPWYAKNEKKQFIESVTATELQGKMFFSIKVL